jgi:hypothetical protein
LRPGCGGEQFYDGVLPNGAAALLRTLASCEHVPVLVIVVSEPASIDVLAAIALARQRRTRGGLPNRPGTRLVG